jgi:hypothetical protein
MNILLYSTLMRDLTFRTFFAEGDRIKKYLNLADMKQRLTLQLIQFMCYLRLILHLFFRHLGIFQGITDQCICEVGGAGLEAVTVAVAEVVLITITVGMVLTIQVVDPVCPITAIILPR